MKKTLSLFILFISICFSSIANNLNITNLQVASVNNGNSTANLSFDISWENSWRDASNWDAVWIFIKYRNLSSTDAFQHATLNTSGHTAPSGSTISTSPDRKGVFLYRNANGNGNITFNSVELVWDFGTDGLTSTDELDIKIFGIEMVYVPQGSFYVGDGQTDNNQVYGNFEAGNTGGYFQITSEGTITLGGGGVGSLGNNNRERQFTRDSGSGSNGNGGSCNGCLPGSGDDFNDVTTQVLAATFPKGFDAFYCMKYEMTQQQFVDMLNCLTPTQQTTYLSGTNTFYPNSPDYTTSRYGITESGGVYSTSTPHVPMIFFDWIKSAAYADWSALRPMTELEFEKACRGFETPVINEYAWGNANIDLSENLTLNNINSENEGIASGYETNGTAGNAWMRAGSQNMQNVARAGIFAANPGNNGRVSSGSSIWGIMELSGNAWERAVSVGHTEGRKFTGLHGDGNLNINGYANVTNWPGTLAGTTVESNIGVGYRGGALAFPTPNLERNARVSSRRLASGYWTTVINDDGVRFVRSAN